MASIQSPEDTQLATDPWRDLTGGRWQSHVDVRDFIQRNYKPYEGDEGFLAGATERTRRLWQKLTDLLEEERKKGQAWGLKTIESFHTYGTPPVEMAQAKVK